MAPSPPERLQAGVAERGARQFFGLTDDLTAVASAGRHNSTESGQHPRGESRRLQARRIYIQRHSQHAGSDVAPNCLRVDERRRGNDNGDAHVRGQMHVWHDRDLLNIGPTSEALNSL
jgi:hypothetical protein